MGADHIQGQTTISCLGEILSNFLMLTCVSPPFFFTTPAISEMKNLTTLRGIPKLHTQETMAAPQSPKAPGTPQGGMAEADRPRAAPPTR